MRRARLLTWAFAVAAAGAVSFWMIRFNPGGLLRPCVFRTLTGIPCPTCGTTHALRDLFGGRPGAAFGSNPLAALLAVAAVVSAIAAIVLLPWADRLRTGHGPSRRKLAWIAVILLLANWAYLIATWRR